MPDSPWGLTSVSVRLGGRTVLDDVSVSVAPGRIVAVVGGDGAGKTTALRTLIGRISPVSGIVRAPAQSAIGFQPATSGTWAHLTVDENLDVVAGAYRLPRDLEAARRDRLLEAAQLTDARDRLAAHLSGGMRQKLGFCMAMLPAPELLVLDEPSTGVDPVSRVELWALISEAAANGAAVLLTTTYLDEAERVQDVVVLDSGTALLSGPPAEVVASAPGTVTLVHEPTDPVHAWRRGRTWRQWHAGQPRSVDQTVHPDLEDAVVAAAFASRPIADLPPVVAGPSRPVGAKDQILAAASHVTKRFGSTTAVDDVSVMVRSGEIVGVIGANGAGKSTLIRMQLGLLLPTAGRITLFGSEPSRQTRARLGYVPQGLGLYSDLTVDENLAFSAGAYGRATMLQDGLLPVADELVGQIGLGRQRQLAFECALAHDPELLVLDEPTSGVDPVSRGRLWDSIHAQADAGAGVLVSTHFMHEAEQCDRLIVMDLGRVVASGTVADIVGDTIAIEVRAADWAAAFAALTNAGLIVALAGTVVRIADADVAVVQRVLAASAITADVSTAAATLDETMAIIAGRRNADPPSARR